MEMEAPWRVEGISYLVCATQRSGSTLLCELLRATDVAGVPDEYFERLRQTGLLRCDCAAVGVAGVQLAPGC